MTALDRLCQFIESTAAGRESRDDTATPVARSYDAEEHIPDKAAFLKAGWRHKQLIWRESLRKAISKCRDENPKYAFLSIHLSYQWFGLFFSPLSWRLASHHGVDPDEFVQPFYELIRQEFKPKYFVNLIDDVYAAQHEIKKKSFNIRLRELLTWREFETVLTDFLAQELISSKYRKGDNALFFPFERSPIVAVRHAPVMLYRLLFKPEIVRIYISFPITEARKQKEYIQEFDEFRARLCEHFTVYDPVTIDELPLQALLENENRQLKASDCWPIPANQTLCGRARNRSYKINIDEIKEITRRTGLGAKSQTILERQIENRDLRMIDQSDCIVAYRPMFRGDKKKKRTDFSGGTDAEWSFAETHGKPRFLVHDRKVDGELPGRVWRTAAGDIPHIISVNNLSDPVEQGKALRKLVKAIKGQANELTRLRLGS